MDGANSFELPGGLCQQCRLYNERAEALESELRRHAPLPVWEVTRAELAGLAGEQERHIHFHPFWRGIFEVRCYLTVNGQVLTSQQDITEEVLAMSHIPIAQFIVDRARNLVTDAIFAADAPQSAKEFCGYLGRMVKLQTIAYPVS